MSGPASWQPDPTGRHDHRYWDGSRWTDHVADAGVASTDPYGPAVAAGPGADEPTVVTPVSGGDTASYPTATAPPYLPPSPTPGGAAPDRGRRRLLIGAAVLAVVVIAVVAILALGGDDDPTEPLADRSPSTTQSQDQGDGSADEGADDGLGEGFPDELSDDEMEQAISRLAEVYGLSEEKTECLVEQISEAAEELQLDPAQAMGDVLGYLSECDISMEELGAN